MKPEHSGIIEAMADAMFEQTEDGGPMEDEILAALRAAAERGYRLARIPPAKDIEHAEWAGEGFCSGWNACLDAIETIEIDKEQN